MRLKYLLHAEGHDGISKQVHVNLTEVNMHGTRIARIVVKGDASHGSQSSGVVPRSSDRIDPAIVDIYSASNK